MPPIDVLCICRMQIEKDREEEQRFADVVDGFDFGYSKTNLMYGKR